MSERLRICQETRGARSRYEYSLRIIHAALVTVPMHTSRAGCERILRPLYPFGERRHWPYKAWRRAVRNYLAERAKLARWTGWREQSAETPLFREIAP